MMEHTIHLKTMSENILIKNCCKSDSGGQMRCKQTENITVTLSPRVYPIQ